MRKILKNQRGFTLVEAILSLLVLSIGVWGGLATFQNATVNSMTSDFRVTANQLATQQVESILADKTFNGYDSIVQVNYPQQALPAPHDNFTRIVTITEVDPTDLSTPQAGSGFKRVDITIMWGVQSYESISVTTVVSDYS